MPSGVPLDANTNLKVGQETRTSITDNGSIGDDYSLEISDASILQSIPCPQPPEAETPMPGSSSTTNYLFKALRPGSVTVKFKYSYRGKADPSKDQVYKVVVTA
jgi:hypothetical protein